MCQASLKGHIAVSPTLAHIDFVWSRVNIAVEAERSWVCDTIDHLTTQDDHESVVWEAKLSRQHVGHEGRRLKRIRFDREKILSPEGQQFLREAMSRYAPPAWSVHPDAHAAHIKDFSMPHFVKPDTALGPPSFLPKSGPCEMPVDARQSSRRWKPSSLCVDGIRAQDPSLLRPARCW